MSRYLARLIGRYGLANQHGPGLFRRLLAERVVDLEQPLLLSFGQVGVGEHRVATLQARRPVLEKAGLHVQRLSRDPQATCDLLQDVGARAAQAPLDLAQVGVRDASRLGELAE